MSGGVGEGKGGGSILKEIKPRYITGMEDDTPVTYLTLPNS